MNVGVLALQGDVSEHVRALERSMRELGLSGGVIELRRPEKLQGLAALLMPGGESTAIAKQMRSSGLWDPIIEFAKAGNPVMGTCAGCILLSSGIDDVSGNDQNLGLMDMAVKRNAYGRQAESFEHPLNISGLEKEFIGVFIRAPGITRTWGRARVMAKLDGQAIMVSQDNILALTFHPELVEDDRVHTLFLSML